MPGEGLATMAIVASQKQIAAVGHGMPAFVRGRVQYLAGMFYEPLPGGLKQRIRPR